MIDMHMHSWWSDGELSPKELAAAAKEKGLTGIALTDHDTFAGAKELLQAGEKLGLEVHVGAEISCMDPGSRRPVHILAYDLEEAGRKQLDEFLAPLRSSMKREVEKSAEALENAGYPVSLERTYQKAGPGKAIFKQMIMEQLMEAGLCREMYGPLYRELFKTGRDGKPPLAKLNPLCADPFEAVKQIRKAGGIPVLAHPGQYDSYALVERLTKAGLMGIEVFHPLHKNDDVEKSRRLAEQYGLKITGGSDYHGKYGEGEVLGECGVDQWPF